MCEAGHQRARVEIVDAFFKQADGHHLPVHVDQPLFLDGHFNELLPFPRLTSSSGSDSIRTRPPFLFRRENAHKDCRHHPSDDDGRIEARLTQDGGDLAIDLRQCDCRQRRRPGHEPVDLLGDMEHRQPVDKAVLQFFQRLAEQHA